MDDTRLVKLVEQARAARDDDVRRLTAPLWRPLKRRKLSRYAEYLGALENVRDEHTDGLAAS